MDRSESPNPVRQSDELRGFVEQQLQIGTWTWDLKSEELAWSDGLFRVLGLDPASAKPSFQLFQKVIHPDDQVDFGDLQAAAILGRLAHRQFRIIRPAGELRWIASHGRLIHSPDGATDRMLGIAVDITETKRAIETYAIFEDLLRCVRELVGGVVWQTAPDGTVVDELEWWRRIDRSYRPGPKWSRHEVIHPEDLDAFKAAWSDAIARQVPYRATYRLRQPDGAYENFASVAHPIKDDEGTNLGWIGISRPAYIRSGVRPAQAREIPGYLFRAARACLGLSAAQFGREAGLSHSSIRRLEGDGGATVGDEVKAHAARWLSGQDLHFHVDIAGMVQLVVGSSVAVRSLPKAD